MPNIIKINTNGVMNDYNLVKNAKLIDTCDDKGKGQIINLYEWSYNKHIIRIYGWNSNCGYVETNKHILPINGNDINEFGIKSEHIKSLNLKENRFGFEPEVTAKISRIPKISIYEVGISYYGRTYDEGKKIGAKDGFRAIYCILKYGLFKA